MGSSAAPTGPRNLAFVPPWLLEGTSGRACFRGPLHDEHAFWALVRRALLGKGQYQPAVNDNPDIPGRRPVGEVRFHPFPELDNGTKRT